MNNHKKKTKEEIKEDKKRLLIEKELLALIAITLFGGWLIGLLTIINIESSIIKIIIFTLGTIIAVSAGFKAIRKLNRYANMEN